MLGLERYPEIIDAAAAFRMRRKELLKRCVELQQIPAPTGQEGKRAAHVARHFEQLDLKHVSVDDDQNAYGCLRGANSQKPAVLVSAHTDTVFPAITDLGVRLDEANGRVYGPGIGDNSTGVASLMELATGLANFTPPVDLWFVANSCEEGLGDLKGMRAVVDRLEAHIGAAIVIEGMGLGRIVHRGLGSKRYRISVTAPGGHSWSDFGAGSAIHALVRLATELSQMAVPARPRTTFNIGRIAGGTSINTIAQDASLELDLRSESTTALKDLDRQANEIVARYQTAYWKQQRIRVAMEVIGDRPSGEIAADHPLVVAAQSALVGAGLTGSPDLRISSTDANIPLSRGIPAVCVGITEGGNAHRMEEWIGPKLLPLGVQHLMLLTWWTADWLAQES